MEDWKLLTADCVVLSCCCQCLILQILVFFFLKFPYKLARKASEYVKKKIINKKRHGKRIQRDLVLFREESLRSHESFRRQLERFSVDRCSGCGCCIEDAEKVFEEMSRRGDFAFGSFWSGEELESFPIPTCIVRHELDYDVVRYKLIGTFDSFSDISLCNI